MGHHSEGTHYVVIKSPFEVYNGLSIISHIAMRPFKSWGDVFGKGEAEWKFVVANFKLGFVPVVTIEVLLII